MNSFMDLKSPIEIRDIKNKGRGYIAQKNIAAGDIILEEKPIQSSIFQGSNPPAQSYSELAELMLATPGLSDLLQFDKNQGGNKKSKALAQVKLNSFIVRDPTDETGFSFRIQLDPKGSFFNHSCFPNATSHLNPISGVAMTYAISDIRAGEEVCICYKTQLLFLPTHRRQQLLQSNWGFLCTCERCTTPREKDALLMSGELAPEEVKKMNAEFDELMESKEHVTNYAEAENWVYRAKNFMEFNLHKAHWRKITIRKELITFLLNPHFPVKNAVKYVEEQISAYSLLAPPLHNGKVEMYLTYKQIGGGSWESKLQKIDPNSKRIMYIVQ